MSVTGPMKLVPGVNSTFVSAGVIHRALVVVTAVRVSGLPSGSASLTSG